MAHLRRTNNPLDWWGPKIREDQIRGPICPTSLTFDNDIHLFSSSCPIFDLGDATDFTFDSIEILFSSESRTFDEEAA